MAPNAIQGYGHAFVVSEEQKVDWLDLLILCIYPKHVRRLKFGPTTPDKFKEITENCSDDIQELAKKLLASLSTIIGIEKDEFRHLRRELAQALRMNYYSTSSKPDQILGASPHSDPTFLTILMQDDDIEALQIRDKEEWIPLKPIPDALIVNVGDVTEIWANDKYESIEHRATINKHKPRMSFAPFMFSPDDVEIETLDHMVDAERHVMMYKEVKHGE